jgi:cullin-4
MGLDLYRKHIMSNDVVQTRTVEGLLLLIEKERYDTMKNSNRGIA